MSRLESPWQQTAKGARYREARVFYRKTGRARYISHLDVTRCMQRAIQRSGLAVWYTEGFNPHIYLTFALPLPLGYESGYEVMDLRLEAPSAEEDCDALCARLNAALPPDIRVWAVAAPQKGAEDVTAACYDVSVTQPGADGKAWLEAFQALLAGPIEVEKTTKKGPRRIDIRPDIEVLGQTAADDGICLRLRLSAGPVRNINPTLLTDAFCRRVDAPQALVRVMRTELLCRDGSRFV